MAKNNVKKKEVTTLGHLRRWKAANFAIRSGMYVCPMVPTGVIMGINWQDWFGKDSLQGFSIGIGFAMLLTAFLSSILAVSKKDKVLQEKTGGFLYIGILFCVIGFSLVMLASIINTLGWYIVYMGVAMFGSMGCSITSDKWSGKWVQFYKEIAEANGLTSPAEKRLNARKKAAEERAAKEREDLL